VKSSTSAICAGGTDPDLRAMPGSGEAASGSAARRPAGLLKQARPRRDEDGADSPVGALRIVARRRRNQSGDVSTHSSTTQCHTETRFDNAAATNSYEHTWRLPKCVAHRPDSLKLRRCSISLGEHSTAYDSRGVSPVHAGVQSPHGRRLTVLYAASARQCPSARAPSRAATPINAEFSATGGSLYQDLTRETAGWLLVEKNA
jgi:hypothetical protein